MPFYTLVELSASFLESLLVIGTITRISGKRHQESTTCSLNSRGSMCNDSYSYLYEHVGIFFIFNHSHSRDIFYLCYETYIKRLPFAPNRILHAYFVFSTHPRLCSWL